MGESPLGARAGGAGGGDREPRGVAALYLDETVSQSILAGLVIFLGAVWSLWGAFWLRRVELHRENDGLVRRLGLTWAREGWGPGVSATGRVGGRTVEVRWRRAVWRGGVRVRVDGVWTQVGGGDSLDGLLGPDASPAAPDA